MYVDKEMRVLDENCSYPDEWVFMIYILYVTFCSEAQSTKVKDILPSYLAKCRSHDNFIENYSSFLKLTSVSAALILRILSNFQ